MEKEQQLYNKFVDVLTSKLDSEEMTAKDLDVVMKFLQYNNIQATVKHKGVESLNNKINELPFDDEELPLKRIK